MATILTIDGVVQVSNSAALFPGGVVQTSVQNLTLSAFAGSYTLTGKAATLSVGRALTGNAGAYVITGGDASFTYTPIIQEYVSTGGLPPKKAKTPIKKSEKDEIEAIVRREFDDLETVLVPKAVSAEVKQAARQKIQQIDFTQYDSAIANIYSIMAIAKAQLTAYEAELDDEETILMLI